MHIFNNIYIYHIFVRFEIYFKMNLLESFISVIAYFGSLGINNYDRSYENGMYLLPNFAI